MQRPSGGSESAFKPIGRIEVVKAKIQEKGARLAKFGLCMEALEDYSIRKDWDLHLVLRLCGGTVFSAALGARVSSR
jgi:hypothetical protein